VYRTLIMTGLAITAFAANSLLCRAALATGEIDAASFTSIRLISGAMALGALVYIRTPRPSLEVKRVFPAAMLFLYAVTFSFAYNSLSAATGALILFGSVQVTMMSFALWRGERPGLLQNAGYGMALAGLLYLMSPGLTAPSLTGSLLMTTAGIAWGGYTLLGRSAADPLIDTANNFLKTIPLALLVAMFGFQTFSTLGVVLAIISGTITSGLGYAIWYTALKELKSTQAASVQLSVPVITAIGGVVLLTEIISIRLLVASVLILSGIICTLIPKKAANSSES
jgi:drug/metabolite transporter (DMT)-like permease